LVGIDEAPIGFLEVQEAAEVVFPAQNFDTVLAAVKLKCEVR
jgi:hypothetical protein